MRVLLYLLVIVSLVPACTGGVSAPDARDATPDAPVDAMPDAPSMCPGELVFTGGYVDWDSTDASFDGVEFATLAQVGAAQNTATTAPNGRGTLCLPATGMSLVDFTQPDYLDLRYTVWPEAAMRGPFEIKGMKPARAETLFADELGVSREAGAAQVLVGIFAYPDMTPVLGAQVQIGNASAGGFHNDGTGTYISGNTTSNDAYILFANVDMGAGQTSVTILPPAGTTCLGPATIDLVAGALSATNLACTQ